MKKICTGIVAATGTVLLASVSYVLANEPKVRARLIIAGSRASITY